MFHFSPITVDKEGETCRQGGGKSTRLFMQEGHLEAASPLSLSLCLAVVLGMSEQMQRCDTKSHYFLNCQTKHAVWQSRSEKVRQRATEEMK